MVVEPILNIQAIKLLIYFKMFISFIFSAIFSINHLGVEVAPQMPTESEISNQFLSISLKRLILHV